MALLDWVKNKLGISQIKFTEPMVKGDKYRLVFKHYGGLTADKEEKIISSLKSRLANDLRITKIAFNIPEANKVTVEGIALHDPIPFLIIGGLIGGIALLFGIRLALESVYKVLNVFSPNKIILLCVCLGVPYLILTKKIHLKGLNVKGRK